MAVPFSLQLRFISKQSSHYLADTTPAFTPNGLTLLNILTQRSAYIIVLALDPRDTGTLATLVSLLRSTTSKIYAEQCDLTPHVSSIYPCFLQQLPQV